MAKQSFTPQQEKAVRTVGRDLLVAASAGTGKTTVLSQRCIHLLLHEKIALRDILAVTFTEAAAADMRGKIANELRDRVNQDPDNEHLRRELLLIDRAPISTLHSFCLKVLRENFHQLDLDPGFGILDPDEAELLKTEVVERVLEDWFARDDEEGTQFLALVEAYGGQGGQRLVEVIVRLHEFMQALPAPEHWGSNVREAYNPIGGFCTLFWKDAYAAAWRRELERCCALADEALAIIDRLGSIDVYRPHVENIRNAVTDWRARVQAGLTADQWGILLAEVRSFEWGRMAQARGAAPEDRDAAQAKIKKVKDRIGTVLQERLGSATPEQFVEDIRQVGPFLDILLKLQQEFATEYTAAKDQQALLDFNDLERNCHRLLTKNHAVANELRRRFKHVLVDEYQDINPLQDAILQSISGGQLNHLFMVGDEKQSIYGFRLAAPDIFMGKYRTFSADLTATQVRISLTHNFRCRNGVIFAVNHVFKQIVVSALGNEYGEEAALTYGANYPAEVSLPDVLPVEVHLIQKDLSTSEGDEDGEAEETPSVQGEVSLAEQTALEREAFLVGKRIQEIIAQQTPIWGGKAYRSARYRDVVILLRTTSRRADAMAGVLKSLGVPVYADLTSGFFDATEVRDMVALLEVLDNAQQGVPLAAVLRSPLVGLSEDQLTAVRTHAPEGRFHVAVKKYQESGTDPEVRQRLQGFQVKVDNWRKDVGQLPLARVVWEIYRQTHYLAYVQGLPAGDARRANLVQLHDRARQFDQFSRRGLFRFLRFLRRLREADQDLGTAPVLSESDDVVRIMSIHKSKGLEFPIVFVPDLAKQFNLSDLREQVLLHRDLLIGVDRVDLNKMARAATLPKMLIAEKKRIEVLAEEQRLLYVALTRARERLILCGTAEVEDLAKTWRQFPESGKEARMLAARCMLDWLGPVLAGHADTASALTGAAAPDRVDESCFDLHLHRSEEVKQWTLTAPAPAATGIAYDDLALLRPVPVQADSATRDTVEAAFARLQWSYSAPHLQELPGKVSVTGFKRRFPAASEDEQPSREQFRRQITHKPVFLSDTSKGVSATERGSATHAVLQHLELVGLLDATSLQVQIGRMVQGRILSQREAEAVDLASIVTFLSRPLGQRLRKAKRMKRELPFSLLLAAGELPDAGHRHLTVEEQQETILIQGIIDCLFWEEDGIVLLDYKTDDAKPTDVLETAANYGSQVKLYRKAVAGVYGGKVKESYLVFLTPGEDVLVKG